MNEWANKLMNESINEWMSDEWMNMQINERIKTEWMNNSRKE